MAHSTPKDPMAKPVLIGGLVLIGAAVAVLVSNLFSTIEKNSTKGAEDTSMQAAAAEINLAPIGKVNAVDKSVAKAARSGEAVYNAVCTSCHSAGVLGAPKIDDKAAWAPRVGNGLDGLMKNAINGLNSMPARGGDPTITDEELTNAVVYMTGKAGHDLSSQVKKAAAPAAQESMAGMSGMAAAPAQESMAGMSGMAAAPAQEGMAGMSGMAAAPAQEGMAGMSGMAAAPAQAAAPAAAVDGAKIYKATCFSCHDVGVANSPKLGDKAAWSARIAAGNDAMYSNALNGKGAMPAKGGNAALSDAEIKAAVDYMVAQSK
ncbi:MAG TPA: c-type cytochrome [Candidatus Thiothrix moscowensis]|uniref:c-type cytochrome n=1 Tax=unclassified Thiothrix TaxID=2636184 RepID=UPI0025F4DD33|nr:MULTISPECIES: c-type cytochrome [unclassified Thiothrix]HRJ54010.1 c-type cytochrome [Candidatus Thiothrix moscowensis]HRJ94092.1 c-type cytochrome [Candidatus Thiothrix moscowensis]